MSMRRGPLSLILVSAMVASTFFIFAVAVLASAIEHLVPSDVKARLETASR